MNLQNFLCFLFILKFINSSSQEINGTIKDSNNVNIENANISFWDSENKETLYGYIYTNEKGEFKFKLNISKVFIEVTALNFKTNSKKIENINLLQKVNFVLESKQIELDEVVIKDEKAVREKNDTVFYNPKKFLNGTERKIEDLLKKLPGMSVNETTGEIKYKGKPIETVKLEDDDLFGGNYTLGTKNISVDMVEQVQAIENYSSNPLLRGIENSEKVAINLKLKKQKTDYSGTANLTNGFNSKILYNDEVSLLGISKKIKSFWIGSYTNYGLDVNNLNSLSPDFNQKGTFEEEFYSNKYIPQQTASTNLPNLRTKFNNTFFINYNVMYKLSRRLSVRNNFTLLYDKTTSFENFSNNYFFNNSENVNNIQESKFVNKSNSFKSDMKLIYNLNKKSLLITNFVVSNQNFNSDVSTIQNKINYYETNLKTNEFFLKGKIEYTAKISEKKALQFFSVFAKNYIPQKLLNTPNNSFISGSFYNNSYQNSESNKESFYNKLTYLESRRKNKHTFSLGYFYSNQPFKSSLNENKLIVDGFENDLNYYKSNLFCEYSSSFNWNNIKFQPYISSNFYIQKLNEKLASTTIEEAKLKYNTKILTTYNFNKHKSIFFDYSIENKTPSEDFLFNNKILLNTNFIKNNITSLDFIKTQNTSLGYKFYELSKQFGFELSFQYEKTENSYISNVMINENFSSLTYFQYPSSIDNKKSVLTIDKQIRLLRLYIKNTTSLSVNNYKNAVTDFIIRTNKSEQYNNSLLLFSNFKFLINFENRLNYNFLRYKSNSDSKSENTTLNNTIKLILKPFENWIFVLSQDYFITNTKTNKDFTFIDFDVKYQSKKQKWLSFNLTGKNLLNNTVFSQTNNSDYSTSIYISNLIPRYFLVSTNFNF